MAIDFDLWKGRAEVLLPHILAAGDRGITNVQAAALLGPPTPSWQTGQRAVYYLNTFLAEGRVRIETEPGEPDGHHRHRLVIDEPEV